MAKSKKAPKNASPKRATQPAATPADDLGRGLYGLAKEIEGVAEALYPLHHLEATADNLAPLSTALESVANAIAAATIARHGSPDERAQAVAHLKGWFWNTDAFPKSD